MNSDLIRKRINSDPNPFVFRLSDGTRVPVTHPDLLQFRLGKCW